MITSIIKLENGDSFGFACAEKIIPKWNGKTRNLFNKNFKEKCLTLLFIQKYLKYIDKNVFFLIMQKMSKEMQYIVPDQEFYKLLYLMQKLNAERVTNIKINTLIHGTSYHVTAMKEYSPEIYSYFRHYSVDILKKYSVTGIIEITQSSMTYYVLQNDKINGMAFSIDFQFFENKKKQGRIFDLLNYHLTNSVKTYIKEERSRYFLFVIFGILLFTSMLNFK